MRCDEMSLMSLMRWEGLAQEKVPPQSQSLVQIWRGSHDSPTAFICTISDMIYSISMFGVLRWVWESGGRGSLFAF